MNMHAGRCGASGRSPRRRAAPRIRRRGRRHRVDTEFRRWQLELRSTARRRAHDGCGCHRDSIVVASIGRRSSAVVVPAAALCAYFALALSTDGVAPSYAGFFPLAIIYVGLTQRPLYVPLVVAIAAPCWLVCQEAITASTLIRLGVAVTMWLLVGLALASRSAVDRARTSELFDRANTDQLTGLASRSMLLDEIARELEAASTVAAAVIVIDLDTFKGVNDMFGHAAGDELLIEIGRRIRASFRPGDTCARLGGDEFAVLMRCAEVRQATEAAIRLGASITEPVTLTRGQVAVTASIGIASIDGTANAAEVLHDADIAMYDAKSAGRNRTSTFRREMGERRTARLQLETELREALQREEFELHYQPVVHLQTGAIVGTEALLRWNHPRRGLLGPDQFLSASEEIGVIVDLGDWILRKACDQAVQWQTIDPTPRHHDGRQRVGARDAGTQLRFARLTC